MENRIDLLTRGHLIKKVVDYRLDNGKRFYKVKWESSWEEEENLINFKNLVDQFWGFIDRVNGEADFGRKVIEGSGDETQSKLNTLAEVTNQQTALNSPLSDTTKSSATEGNVSTLHDPNISDAEKQILNRPEVSLSTKAILKKSIKKDVDKVFFCNVCSRGFSRRDMCARHERLHTKEFCYFCNICAQGFMRRYVLVRHLARVHQTDDINQILTTKKQRRDGFKSGKVIEKPPTAGEGEKDMKMDVDADGAESQSKEEKIQIIEAYKLNEDGLVDPDSLKKFYFHGSSIVVHQDKENGEEEQVILVQPSDEREVDIEGDIIKDDDGAVSGVADSTTVHGEGSLDIQGEQFHIDENEQASPVASNVKREIVNSENREALLDMTSAETMIIDTSTNHQTGFVPVSNDDGGGVIHMSTNNKETEAMIIQAGEEQNYVSVNNQLLVAINDNSKAVDKDCCIVKAEHGDEASNIQNISYVQHVETSQEIDNVTYAPQQHAAVYQTHYVDNATSNERSNTELS